MLQRVRIRPKDSFKEEEHREALLRITVTHGMRAGSIIVAGLLQARPTGRNESCARSFYGKILL